MSLEVFTMQLIKWYLYVIYKAFQYNCICVFYEQIQHHKYKMQLYLFKQ